MFDAFALPMTTVLPFAATSLLIELTPGPNMTYLALVSASEGRRAGLATVAGIALGLAVIGVIAALGLTEIVQSSPALYETLRWSGVAFLLYLAWDGWRSSAVVSAADRPDRGRHFRRGLITNLLNPKAGVFYVTVLPTFMSATAPPLPQALMLTAIYVAVATAVHAGIALVAGGIEPLLNTPATERRVRRGLSAMLALVALWFAWTTSR